MRDQNRPHHQQRQSGQGHVKGKPSRGPKNQGRPGPSRRDQGPAQPRRPKDLRRSNREDRGRSPEIDEDVTGRELDRDAARQLGTLNDVNRTWVAKHLVMAGRLIDVDPSLACDHAIAASRRGGRLAVVREAVGLTAYAAGDYQEALRELRTYRRISGDQTHLPVMVDCLRGLERPQKAVELASEPEADKLTGAARAELAIVVSGAYEDLGDHTAALHTLEIPELDINRAFSFSPRLYTRYAEVLTAVGRDDEAVQWRSQVARAEKALGTGLFEDPEIMDFDDEEGTDSLPKIKDLLGEEQTEADDTGQGEDDGGTD